MAGMAASIAATRLMPAQQIEWRTTPIAFQVKPAEKPRSPGSGKAEEAKARADQAMGAPRTPAPPGLLSLELSTLTIGPLHILHLPGECFVEFQLFAQQQLPAHRVAVVACCDNGPGYVCTERAFSEGGYEPTASRVAPDSEHLLKAAIRQSLGVP
jgi:hypothetical protein